MRRRRFAGALISLVRVALLLTILFHPSGAAWGQDADEPEASATPTPTDPAAGAPLAAQPAPTGNNVVGLNVARLRKDRYIYAAADLVNANGGDWGYLTVVFTATERDSASGERLLQELLDRCYEQHLQPIIRVATTFDIEAEVWSRPAPDDAEKWRAFLEKGRWPVKHAWIIAGNEPNLGREWGGEVDSATYAEYLSHFIDVFADQDRFRIVNGPLDASNTSEMPKMQDAYEFLTGMDAAVPGIFSRLAGWASNPYAVPNQGPDLRYTYRAYEAELDAIGRDMPVLITEAGHLNTGDDKEIAAFYEEAFRHWMADSRVIAVTPLFWHPDRGVYWMFDFDATNHIINKTPTYDLIMNLPRQRGSPEWEPDFGNTARGEPKTPPTRSPVLAVQPAAPAADAADTPAPVEDTPAPSATSVPPTSTAVPATATSAPTPRAVAPTPTLRANAATNPQPTATPTGPAEPIRYLRVGNTDGDAVRLRQLPTRSAPAIAAVPAGTRVQALGAAERQEDLVWQRVRIPDGRVGWIATDFLIPD